MISCPSCKSRRIELVNYTVYACHNCGKVFTTIDEGPDNKVKMYKREFTVIHKSEAEKLAEEHWDYIESLLEIHDDEYIKQIGFHYKQAFRHGYKHGVENTENTIKDMENRVKKIRENMS